MATVLSAGSDFRSLSRQPPPDPDIQATLSDFLTYTEHFPSHLTRALTLIDDQRIRAERRIQSIHNDTTTYTILPSITTDRPDPTALRRDISYALEEAERACRMAVEEAARLNAECEREAKRLDLVTERLKAQPMPPSRDPTPEQKALTSPNLKRERGMSTRGDDKLEHHSRHLDDRAAVKLRGRKVMVPGEVLPPPDPNAPAESISDWTSPRASPPLEEPPVVLEKKATPRPRSRTPKIPKPERERDRNRERAAAAQKARGPRAPGQPGTNAHSAIAGISTSNALLALAPPPDDAANGSRWLPWMKLTEWEMAKLRKRMKKNAIWVPSQTMVRRELKNLGRGVSGKEAARGEAGESGTAFVDEHGEHDPTKVIVTGEETAQMNAMLGPQQYAEDEDADAELINRGMRLNEAKKLKRQRMLDEQAQEKALQAQLLREQGVEMLADGKNITVSSDAAKKRKRESTPHISTALGGVAETPDPLSKAGPAPKRLKITAPAASSSKVPLAPAGASSSPRSTARNRTAATPPAVRKPTLILKAGKAVSEEPPNRRASLRRNSNASLPGGTTITSPATAKPAGGGRRSKRPAPGILTSADAESAKVGVSKRKAAPKKKGTASTATKAENSAAPLLLPAFEPEEIIDPNEPRYCLCGDVSWGNMIGCDNEESCEKEWFHLACVGLTEPPPRRTKWYCPDCRKKLRVGVGTNGLVGRAVGR